MPECPERKYFIAIVLVAIVYSFILGETLATHPYRFRGLFNIPHDFAHMILMLLFFIDEKHDSLARQAVAHSFVFVFLLLSTVGGAILAYLAGLAFKYRADITRLLRYKYLPKIAAVAAVAVLLYLVFGVPEKWGLLYKRVIYQFTLIAANIEEALQGRYLNYYYFDMKYGMNVSSGIWRLTYWTKIFKLYWNSSAINILIGHGAGSVKMAFGMEPHNDFLRLLFEYGAVGMGIFIYFFTAVFRQVQSWYRYIIIITAVYCLSGNTLDNMAYLTMFTAFIATVQNNRDASSMQHGEDS
jgi:O-antigen ligase